jgi:hypothetical protein
MLPANPGSFESAKSPGMAVFPASARVSAVGCCSGPSEQPTQVGLVACGSRKRVGAEEHKDRTRAALDNFDAFCKTDSLVLGLLGEVEAGSVKTESLAAWVLVRQDGRDRIRRLLESGDTAGLKHAVSAELGRVSKTSAEVLTAQAVLEKLKRGDKDANKHLGKPNPYTHKKVVALYSNALRKLNTAI